LSAQRPRGVVSTGSWFLLSSRELPELVAHQATAASKRGHLYCPVPVDGPWLHLDDSVQDDWPVSRVSVDEGRICTSVMYPSCLYSAETEGEWMVGSDLFLLAAALGGLDRVDIRRIPPFSEHMPGACTESLDDDPVESAWRPTINDGKVAGAQLLQALRDSVLASATAAEDGPPAVLLSGGVDSAALAWTAHRLGLEPVAYSIGTDWGDEHDQAAELASHCGIPHRRIHLTTEDLVGAIRPSIRQLGHAEAESVDSVLNMVAALRSGQIEERTVLTGWGSDLLNAGLLSAPCPGEQMIESLVMGLRRTQLSSEFSAGTAGRHGYRLFHPYWHRRVVETSLAIDPACKYGPREKQHLRAAIADHIPASVAWREKIALHHGTGVEQGLSKHFGGPSQKALVYTETFHDIASRSVVELLRESNEERPVEAVAATKGAL
jgi:asparagine synthetase B (glutamine-hydrolysing)